MYNLLLDEFNDQGWFLIRGGFADKFRLAALNWIYTAAERAKVDKGLEAEFETNSFDEIHTVRKLRRLIWNDISFWSDLLEQSGVFNLVKSLVKEKPALIYHAAFLKPKVIGSAIGFHQDQALWNYDYPNAVNVWIALTDSNSQNGCLQLFTRSHLLGLLPHMQYPDYHWHLTVSKEKLRSYTPCEVPMFAGDIIVWHRYLVHGSGPNKSESDRIGMVMAFVNMAEPNFKAEDIYPIQNTHNSI